MSSRLISMRSGKYGEVKSCAWCGSTDVGGVKHIDKDAFIVQCHNCGNALEHGVDTVDGAVVAWNKINTNVCPLWHFSNKILPDTTRLVMAIVAVYDSNNSDVDRHFYTCQARYDKSSDIWTLPSWFEGLRICVIQWSPLALVQD
jgi:hypothetical protein